jgi:hypothetical protein
MIILTIFRLCTGGAIERKDQAGFRSSSFQPMPAMLTTNQLSSVADQEESELLQFFLFTGARDKEVQHATWRDVELLGKRPSPSARS